MRPEIGMMLYGYSGGAFGSDYDAKRIEAFGVDWIVVRDRGGEPLFASFRSMEDRDMVVATSQTDPDE